MLAGEEMSCTYAELPKHTPESFGGADRGVSLRDYFAAAALTGLPRSSYSGCEQHMAEKAYKIADAMLKARGE